MFIQEDNLVFKALLRLVHHFSCSFSMSILIMLTVGSGEALRGSGSPFCGAAASTMHSSLPVVLIVIVGILSDQMELCESCLIVRRRWESLRLGNVIGPAVSSSSRSSMVAVGAVADAGTIGGFGGLEGARDDVLLPKCSGALGVGDSGSGVGGISKAVELDTLDNTDGGGGGV